MILNHKDAINYIATAPEISLYSLNNIHSFLMSGLLEQKSCGLLRNNPVAITGTVYHPLEERSLILSAMEKISEISANIEHPVERAMYLMSSIAYVQPYEDGNKRTARIAMNLVLVANGYPPFSFKGVDKKKYIQGIIGFYELGGPGMNILKQIFLENYRGSGKEYVSRYQYKENPEAVIYRVGLRKVIHDLHVLAGPPNIKDLLKKYDIPVSLEEHVLSEASVVHNGNCALYGLAPKEINESVRSFKALTESGKSF